MNKRRALSDGSVVELREGSRIEVAYTATVRRVRLHSGEAFFTVAKHHRRPFIVEARGVEVHAVGTQFNVRIDPHTVEVLVTEGKVLLTSQIHPLGARAFLEAGACAIVPLQSSAEPVKVTRMTAKEIRSTLLWQVPRLQFYETPLREAVAEFNRNGTEVGRPKLVLGDSSIGDMHVGGTFRVNDVHGFVRLLKVTMGIWGVPQGDNEIVLVKNR